MADTHELTPEEMDERNQRLIQDLHRKYPTSAKVAQSLARVEQRLFHSGDGTQQGDMITSLPQMSQRTQQERADTIIPKGKAWRRRFETLAAAVFAALLVGTLILVLHLTQQSRIGGAGTPLNQALVITSLHMIDATTGWAIAGKAVLRTTDGGYHWKDITPSRHPIAPGSAADFFTASMAWIAIPQVDKTTTRLLHTSDSGRSWQQSTVQARFVRQMSFIDDLQGWILAGNAHTGGAAETVSVLRTTDGGKTWQSVSAALPADVTPPDQLPYGGQKSGLRFVNASTGWVTGTVMLNNVAWLYMTHDGGLTWHQQMLSLPTGVPPAQLSIIPPTFYSATDGLLPVRFYLTTGKGIATVIYMTHDGGTTWHGTMPIFVALSASHSHDFVALSASHFLDMRHGWLTYGTTLFVTSDTGQHWAKLTTSANFNQITQIDFASAIIGWALGNQSNGSPTLLKTTNGGRTWTQITPLIS